MFLERFDSVADIEREFGLTPGHLKGAKILLAYYNYEDYSGDAFVLYRKGRMLFEVNGGHCSCHGLEDQWEPELTDIAALQHRLEKGNLKGKPYGTHLQEILEQLRPKRKRAPKTQSSLTA